MKVLDLRCQQDHAFEGWFASEEEYLNQRQRGLLECPLCADTDVRKVLSAPRINLGARANEVPPSPPVASAGSETIPRHEAAIAPEAQAAWMQRARQLLALSEDVGPRFAEEARRMHRGDAPERSIKGSASMAEAAQLLDEGIPVLALPPAATDTLH